MNELNWTGFLVKLGRQDPCQQVKRTKLLFWPAPNTTNTTPYFHSSGRFDLLQTPQRGLLISTALDGLTYSRRHKEDSLFPQLWTVWPTPDATKRNSLFPQLWTVWPTPDTTKRTPYFPSSGRFDLLQTPQRGLLISTALDCLTYSKHHKEELLISTALDGLTYSRHYKEDSLFPQLWTVWPTPDTTKRTPYFHSSGLFDLLQTPQRGTPYFHSSGQSDLLQTPQKRLLISTALDYLQTDLYFFIPRNPSAGSHSKSRFFTLTHSCYGTYKV